MASGKGTLNRVELIGRLGADPDCKFTTSGAAVVTLSVATNRVWKDQAGEKVERTDWHRCIVWRKLAEIITEFLKKGSLVYLAGHLETRSWDDKNGVTRYTTEVIVNEMVMLGGKGDGSRAEIPPPEEPPEEPPAETYHQPADTQQAPTPANAPSDDDLPF